jgi:uncharacterized membrane protein
MQHTEDDRILAALAHAGIVANVANLAGMVVTSLIWLTQRDRSRYVGAHALQSLVYQGLVLLIGSFLLLSWVGCMLVGLLLPPLLRPDLYRDSGPPASFWLALFGLIIPLGFGVLATLYGLYGAYQVYRGRSFRYPLVGRLVGSELRDEPEPAAPAPATPLPAPQATIGAWLDLEPPTPSQAHATPVSAPQAPIDPSLAPEPPAPSPTAASAPVSAPQAPIDPWLDLEPPTPSQAHATPVSAPQAPIDPSLAPEPPAPSPAEATVSTTPAASPQAADEDNKER